MKRNNKIYIGVAVALVIAAILYFSLRHTESDGHDHGAKDGASTEEPHSEEESEGASKEVELNEAQYAAAAIELGTFSQKNLSDVLSSNGYTELPPQNKADVSVFMAGIVKSIAVTEGQMVRKGQVLAMVESPEFATLQEDYLISKSNLEFLTLEYERQRILSEQEVNSKKVFQRTKAEFNAEKARFNSLKRQLSVLNITPGTTPSARVPVVAPISGAVTEINIKIGSNVEPGTSLLGIVDNSKLHVDLLVYEKDLGKVRAGQNVRFVLTNQDNTEITGKIFSIGQSFENDSKAVAVHVDLDNAKLKLIPGMYVNGLIDIGASLVNALPTDAVIKAEGKEFIFILEEDHQESAHDDAKGHSEEPHDEKEGHAHNDGDKHEEKDSKTYHFKRVEVKTGSGQLGFIQVSPLQPIPADAKIALKGAYYIQSHLQKSAGGGGHAH